MLRTQCMYMYDIILVFYAFQDIRGQFLNCAYMYMHFVFLSGKIQISIVDCSSHEVHFVYRMIFLKAEDVIILPVICISYKLKVREEHRAK